MDAPAEIGRNPASRHQIKPAYGEIVGWRGTRRENPSRETKFSGATGGREMLFFPIQLTTSRIGNLSRLIHTLLYVKTKHTYIHKYIHTVHKVGKLEN